MTSIDGAPTDVLASLITLDRVHPSIVLLSVAFHYQLLYIYWSRVCISRAVGRSVEDTYSYVGCQTTRGNSRLEDLHCAKVSLDLGDKTYDTIPLSCNRAFYKIFNLHQC